MQRKNFIGVGVSLGLILSTSPAMTQPVPAASPAVPAPAASAEADPALWPVPKIRVKKDPRIERRIDKLIAAMSLEDKVGQLIQVDIADVTPSDLLTYKLGSILNGGNSSPGGIETAPPAAWLKLADDFYDASMTRTDGRPKVPVIWGTDAVHGNNNVIGATLFPHNIGLGASRNPGLIRDIGKVTAIETVAAGQDWSFAPTVAVAQDDRWGRTYESYSEEPEVVESIAGAVVEGLQGKAGGRDFLSPGHVISSTKHFLADGGTTGGRDQGNARLSERELIDVHLAGYRSALAAGTQIVMVSFSSWNGVKMTANRSLLTGVLKERMRFDGFLVSDWNAHGQLKGCSNESCAAAINAGLDMFMYSGKRWKDLFRNTVAQAKSGEIPAGRLDDAVRRILRVKLRAGLFEAGKPSVRRFAGQFDLIGAPAHRAIARQAVRESLVLLKNDGGVLPLRPQANILVAGAADSIAKASGGWSISWQGTGVTNADFPNGQSIWSGIKAAVDEAGGKASLSPDGSYTSKPDAAIVVFGEEPYAEGYGDRRTLEFSPRDKSALEMLRRLKQAGIPVVAIFLSGRPLWVNAEINASDAFVAAFLPGTEGGGVADLLFRDKAGRIAHDFKGKLSFSWPKRLDQYVLNRRDAGYDPLFPFGYGLTYASKVALPKLDEAGLAIASAADVGPIFGRGRVPEGWTMLLRQGDKKAEVKGGRGELLPGGLGARAVDRRSQEDALALKWRKPDSAEIRFNADRALDIGSEVKADKGLVLDLRVDEAPTGMVELGIASNGPNGAVMLPITGLLTKAPVGQWFRIAIPLRCFTGTGLDVTQIASPMVIRSSNSFAMTLSDAAFAPADGACPKSN